MKITERKLRSIICDEINEVSGRARKLYPEDCKHGYKYELGYRTHRWTSTFLGWHIYNPGSGEDAPRMQWTDDNGSEWEAYMFEGKMSVGTSADPLIIYADLGPDQLHIPS